MRVKILSLCLLACVSFSMGASHAEDNVHSAKNMGVYLSTFNGEPKSSSVGFNFAHNFLGWFRATVGLGTEGTYGGGLKVMIPPKSHFTFILGYNYSHLGPSARTTSLDAFGSTVTNGNYWYPTHGFDYQFDNGFMIGVGVLFVNAGYFF